MQYKHVDIFNWTKPLQLHNIVLLNQNIESYTSIIFQCTILYDVYIQMYQRYNIIRLVYIQMYNLIRRVYYNVQFYTTFILNRRCSIFGQVLNYISEFFIDSYWDNFDSINYIGLLHNTSTFVHLDIFDIKKHILNMYEDEVNYMLEYTDINMCKQRVISYDKPMFVH